MVQPALRNTVRPLSLKSAVSVLENAMFPEGRRVDTSDATGAQTGLLKSLDA